MAKVRLNPEELAVESFDTIPVATVRGTVEGQLLQWTAAMNGYTCQAAATCWQGGSCPAFSCVSQCAARCFDDWSEDCAIETADNTCWPLESCDPTCLASCTC
jgi:hypothetical protein